MCCSLLPHRSISLYLVFLLTAFTSGAAQGGGALFATATDYSSGGYQATWVAAKDINGDGKVDLAVTNWCATYSNCANGTVGVLLGNGDGTFGTAAVYSSGGVQASSVGIADVNRDGKADLLVTNEDGTVGVLLNNGNGTFRAPVSYYSGAVWASSVAVADVNGDGNPDLLVAHSGGAAVLFGNGDGTFQAAVNYSWGGADSISIAVADVNGDGNLDLIVSDRSDSNIAVLLGNGDGTFGAEMTYSSGGYLAGSVAVDDINGDGKLDLLVTNEDGPLDVLLGNGDGTFNPAVSYGLTGQEPLSLSVADVNDDGKLDAVVANGCGNSGSTCANQNVSVLLGNGDGTFQAALGLASGGPGAYSVAAIDVNGDGKPDLLVANQCVYPNYDCGNGSVGVLLNQYGQQFSLAFPLHGMNVGENQNLTPRTAQINTVFDHMMLDGAGDFSVYGCDKNVEDFVGEIGNTKPSKFHVACRHGYQNVTKGFEFLQGVANYSPSDPTNLYYDGHPGYDFQSDYGNQVYAAASGTVSYPTLSQLNLEGIWVGGNPDVFNVMELDPGNGYKIFYLHLSTHTRNIATGPLTSSLMGQDFIATKTGKTAKLKPGTLPAQSPLFISGQVSLNGQPLPGVQVNLNGNVAVGEKGACSASTNTDSNGNYMFVGLGSGYKYNLYISPTKGYTFAAKNPSALVPDGTSVSAGELIALSGDAGPCIPSHLHFEVQQETSKAVTMYPADSKQTMQLNYVPVDPYGWSPSDKSKTDPYTLIPELQGAGVTNLYIWNVGP